MNYYPIWTDESLKVMLREVGPGLHVGSALTRASGPWKLVIDLSGDTGLPPVPTGAHLVALPFRDGDAFPPGYLDRLLAAVGRLDEARPVLVHCQAGCRRAEVGGSGVLRKHAKTRHCQESPSGSASACSRQNSHVERELLAGARRRSDGTPTTCHGAAVAKRARRSRPGPRRSPPRSSGPALRSSARRATLPAPRVDEIVAQRV